MKKKKPELGDRRIITKFAFFPVTIGLEVRWLETVSIEQVFQIECWQSSYGTRSCETWKNISFEEEV